MKIAGFCNRILTDKIIANCEAAKKSVIEQDSVKPDKVLVIHNAVDMSKFSHIKAYSSCVSREHFKVGVLANLRYVKGHDIFIQAVALLVRKHKNITFELAGDGDRAWIKQLIYKYGVQDYVRLIGIVDNSVDWLSTLDVAVISSRAEALSNALLEYMAAGRPIVATRVGGNPEVIEDEKTALLVEPNDPKGMADAIDRLLKDDRLREKLSKSARNSALKKFSITATVKQYEAVWMQK